MEASWLFDLWAPRGAVWSRWAKPVLFAEMGAVTDFGAEEGALPALSLPADPGRALVIDLPGADSVQVGLGLARQGYRPVPLFNSTPGPAGPPGGGAVIDLRPVVEWLMRGQIHPPRVTLPDDAPPAFLLDSRRQPAEPRPAPGRFDNRWLVIPQDFPSAGFLKSRGIERALLVQDGGRDQPSEDLAHVLLRWQEAGIGLFLLDRQSAGAPQPLQVQRPSRFKALWYCALASMGFRRNSAGGFGGVVPHPSSG